MVTIEGSRPAPLWPVKSLYVLFAAMVCLAATIMPNHPDRVEEFQSTVTVGYLFVFLLRLVVAHVRDERGRNWVLHVVILVTVPVWSFGLGWLLLQVLPDPYHMRH